MVVSIRWKAWAASPRRRPPSSARGRTSDLVAATSNTRSALPVSNPIGEAPADEAPADEAPADEAPADEATNSAAVRSRRRFPSVARPADFFQSLDRGPAPFPRTLKLAPQI